MMWPAATMASEGYPSHMAPSLDVTVWFHQGAADAEWLLVDARSPFAGDGLVGGVARVWSDDGRLLASGGQQMLCRPTQWE